MEMEAEGGVVRHHKGTQDMLCTSGQCSKPSQVRARCLCPITSSPSPKSWLCQLPWVWESGLCLACKYTSFLFINKLWVQWGGRHSWNRELKWQHRNCWTGTEPNSLHPRLPQTASHLGSLFRAGRSTRWHLSPCTVKGTGKPTKASGGNSSLSRLQAQVYIAQWRSALARAAARATGSWGCVSSQTLISTWQQQALNRNCSCGKHQEPYSEKKQKAFSYTAFTRCSHRQESIDSECSQESWDKHKHLLPRAAPALPGPRISPFQGVFLKQRPPWEEGS